MVEITVKTYCNKETCGSCKMLSRFDFYKMIGHRCMLYSCMLFNHLNADGVDGIQRCDQCVAEFGESE